MKNLSRILWIVLLGYALYAEYTSGMELKSTLPQGMLRPVFNFAILAFTAGVATVALFYGFIFEKVSATLNLYRRELEKSSVNKTESDSKVKVLESKIQVLEKALDEALKK